MAGVVPVVPPRTGCLNGKMEVQTDRFITLDELLKNYPAARAFLDELTRMGRHYYFIDGHGTVVLEMELSSAEYKWQTQEHPRGGFAYNLSIEFGRQLPKVYLKNISNLDRFIVNICSKDYSRGVTVDLKNDEITYVHDSLWALKGDRITEEAKDVLKILQWLIEKKKFKLVLSGGMVRYRKLAALPRGKNYGGQKHNE